MSKTLEIYPENFTPTEYKVNYLGHGDSFNCYLTKGKKVYKEAKQDYDLIRYKRCIEKQLKIKSQYFAFPETIIYNQQDNNKYILNGFITPYIDGIPLLDLTGKENIYEIIKGFEHFEKSLQILTSKKIKSNDLHTENLFYTKDKKIVAIDTLNFEIDNDITIEAQVADINGDIHSAFFDQLSLLKENKIAKIYNLSQDGKIKTSEFLILVKNYFEAKTKTEITTVNQMQTISKKLAK